MAGEPLLGAVKTVALAAALVVLNGAAIMPACAQAPAPAVGAQAKPAASVPAKPVPKKALDKPLWAALSPAQKIALAPIADEWDQAEGVRKQKWLEIANRFASMKPDEQARVHERMRDLFKMSPEERRVVRENYTRAKKIDPSQKSEEWEKYQQLPEEQKKQLAAEAASARAKKQVANLPSPSQSNVKTVAPIKRTPPPLCAQGTVVNTAAVTPPCVPAPAAAALPPPPATPASPAPNAK
ncbi:MAG: DUF3106 domain-containing protein [Pseudomonadota bacterium]|nr:DUF3106 domain-containing protein [Pseudomonadota bacterium]